MFRGLFNRGFLSKKQKDDPPLSGREQKTALFFKRAESETDAIKTSGSLLTTLPDDVILHLGSLLNGKSLGRCLCVSIQELTRHSFWRLCADISGVQRAKENFHERGILASALQTNRRKQSTSWEVMEANLQYSSPPLGTVTQFRACLLCEGSKSLLHAAGDEDSMTRQRLPCRMLKEYGHRFKRIIRRNLLTYSSLD